MFYEMWREGEIKEIKENKEKTLFEKSLAKTFSRFAQSGHKSKQQETTAIISSKYYRKNCECASDFTRKPSAVIKLQRGWSAPALPRG
ncbi:MAG: hypothetical protein ACI4KR_06635 [Ruminiclostridium sp.]